MRTNPLPLVLSSLALALVPGHRLGRLPSRRRRTVHVRGLLVLPAGRRATSRRIGRDARDVLPLAFHVTYWNSLGWRDPYLLRGGDQPAGRCTRRKLGRRLLYAGDGGGWATRASSARSAARSPRRSPACARRGVVTARSGEASARSGAAALKVAIGAGSGQGPDPADRLRSAPAPDPGRTRREQRPHA